MASYKLLSESNVSETTSRKQSDRLSQRLSPRAKSDVTVVTPKTRRERKQFLNLPWQIYRDCPYWIPPLRRNQEELVGYRKHPFYDNAAGQSFLAYRDNRPVGRILAIDNKIHNEAFADDPRGFIGFFESIDDQQVADALFDAARGWLRERGLTNLRGPANPSINYEWGLLIDPFDMPPTFMLTYNHEYYIKLWENIGFEKVQDMFSYFGHRDYIPTLEEKVTFIAEEASRRLNVKLRQIDKKRFNQDVQEFLNIYNQALIGTWGFIPLSDAEVVHMSKSLQQLIEPQLTLVAEIDGKAVGMIFGMLDYNPRIKEIDGRLFPFGFLKLMTRRREIKRVRFISTNVLPEYQRWGVGVILTRFMLEPALDFGIEEAEFSWVLETNYLSRKSLERGGLSLEKTHRVYDFNA